MAKDALPTPVATKKYEAEERSVRADTGKCQRFLLIAPPKHGKTTTAASMSRFFPKDFPNHTGFVDLSDGYLIQFDTSGHDSIGARGMDMPYVNLAPLTDAVEIEQTFYSAVSKIAARVAAGTTSFAIVDSWSELNTKLATSIGARGLEGWDLYGEVGAICTRMFQRIAALPIDIVFTSHLKARNEDDKVAKNVWAVSLPGAGDLIVDMPNKSASLFRRNASWIMPVICSRSGKNTPPEYALYPNGNYGIEGGCRYAGIVADKEPPRLYDLLQKVRGKVAA